MDENNTTLRSGRNTMRHNVVLNKDFIRDPLLESLLKNNRYLYCKKVLNDGYFLTVVVDHQKGEIELSIPLHAVHYIVNVDTKNSFGF